ncbi:MAG: DUF4258 domain-containing protein [Chitinophagales bacterium]|nr:DUF4258 domain-containing protein [Chitinophagales bacterium]
MDCNGIITSLHAFKRMLERNITPEQVEEAIAYGEIIKEHPDDKPYASMLILKIFGQMPLHIVISKNEVGACIVITVYVPDIEVWEHDFKTKKPLP